MSLLNRYLTVWIFLAILAGIVLGNLLPETMLMSMAGIEGGTNIYLAIGLILMMYPPLAKVNYADIFSIFKKPKLLFLSIGLNWIFGPIFMFLLAFIFLKDNPGYFQGVILIGLARCIAMVLVWNDLGKGNKEYAAALVAINSLFQVFTYALYAWFFLEIIPPFFGIQQVKIALSIREVALNSAIYLGIPFLAGFVTRSLLVNIKGNDWYQKRFLPFLGPLGLIALLFTIIYMFSLRAHSIITLPFEVIKIAVPLLIYFVVMFIASFFFGKKIGANYSENAAISFTATGNNFELAIAIAVSIFGIQSDAAFAGIIGPLIEVPALILLVRLSLYFKRRYYPIER